MEDEANGVICLIESKQSQEGADDFSEADQPSTVEVGVYQLSTNEDGSCEYLLTFVQIDHLIQAQS